MYKVIKYNQRQFVHCCLFVCSWSVFSYLTYKIPTSVNYIHSNVLNYNTFAFFSDSTEQYWLGINDRVDEMVYKTYDDQPMTWDNFVFNGHFWKDCCTIIPEENYLWLEGNCVNEAHKAVCEHALSKNIHIYQSFHGQHLNYLLHF